MAPKTTTEAAAPSTTIGGHAVQIIAFIPDNKADMRAQAKVLDLLADVKEGKLSVADLAPHLRGIEVRAVYTRKRFTAEEAKALQAPVAAAKLDGHEEE